MSQNSRPMPDVPSPDDAERQLALSYAPGPVRPALGVLFALDARLGSLLRQSSDAMVGQLRVTWWYEALIALDKAPPPAEPLLRALAAQLLPLGITGAQLAAVTDGWELLLGDDLGEPETLARYAAARGGKLFALAAQVMGAADRMAAIMEKAGEGWALVDLARHVRDPVIAHAALAAARPPLAEAAAHRWPAALRSLGALAVVARADARQSALPLPPTGSPRRVARMLWHRISGR